MKTSHEIIIFDHVFFNYGSIVVLEDIDFSILSDDMIAVIGPNGGGKTTLLRLILGLIKPSRGNIRLFGRDPEKSRHLTGYLPQQQNFDHSFPLNVYETVLMGRYRGIGKRLNKADEKSAMDALETVGMAHMSQRHISMLSGGQIQRIMIARAIVGGPEILLLDEPLSGVDTEAQKSFYDLILKLSKNIAIVFVTHDVGVISQYFEKVICLNRKLFYHGPKEGSIGRLEDAYGCPVEVLAHGIPHRVLKEH